MEKENDTPEVLDAAPSPVPAVTPVAPKGVTNEETDALKMKAADILANIKNSEDRSIVRDLGKMGTDAQEAAGTQVSLLKTRVGSLLNDLDGDSAAIPANLTKLTMVFDDINPHKLMEPRKAFFGIMKKVPVIGDVLAEIGKKYQTVQTQIDDVIGGLYAGKDQLIRDSIDLETLYKQTMEAQKDLQKTAYFGEMLMAELQVMIDDPATDAVDKKRFESALNKVSIRTQDMRVMEQVNNQFFISIDMTVDNNDKLADSIDRTVTVGRSLLTVGLAIQVALANQKKIAGAVQKTQEYMGDMLAANASAVRTQTQEIAEMQNNPVIAMDKLKAGYDDLMAAVEYSQGIQKAGIESAKAGIATINDMNSGMKENIDATHGSRTMALDGGATQIEE
ncbi:MAG: toxic anion resistance protein [Candidatus Peribacteraceae bacterium]|nr:toxic anion resistance protein [Candidatus Peribacteraceae bacterium]